MSERQFAISCEQELSPTSAALHHSGFKALNFGVDVLLTSLSPVYVQLVGGAGGAGGGRGGVHSALHFSSVGKLGPDGKFFWPTVHSSQELPPPSIGEHAHAFAWVPGVTGVAGTVGVGFGQASMLVTQPRRALVL